MSNVYYPLSIVYYYSFATHLLPTLSSPDSAF